MIELQQLVITDAGLAAMAQAGGLETNFARLQLGAADYSLFDADGNLLPGARARTSLQDLRVEVDLAAGAVGPAQGNLNQIITLATIPSSISTFTAREIGIVLDDGTLFAVGVFGTAPVNTGVTDLSIRWILVWDDTVDAVFNVTVVGDAALSTLIGDQAQLREQIRRVVIATGVTYDDTVADQLINAVSHLIDALDGDVTAALAQKSDVGHVHFETATLATAQADQAVLLSIAIAEGEAVTLTGDGSGLSASDLFPFNVFAGAVRTAGGSRLVGTPLIKKIFPGTRHDGGWDAVVRIDEVTHRLELVVNGAADTAVEWEFFYQLSRRLDNVSA